MTQIYKILLFMKKRPDITTEQFRDYYENHHAPLAMKYSGSAIKRYIRRYIEPLPHPETGEFTDGPDVITELWFEDEGLFRGTVAYLSTTLMPDEIVEDEKNLFDRSSFRMATVVEKEF